MVLEIARLIMGLLIAALHRPIADFISDRERSLVVRFRQRGLAVPAALSYDSARTLYFTLGIFVVLFQMLRIYAMSR